MSDIPSQPPSAARNATFEALDYIPTVKPRPVDEERDKVSEYSGKIPLLHFLDPSLFPKAFIRDDTLVERVQTAGESAFASLPPLPGSNTEVFTRETPIPSPFGSSPRTLQYTFCRFEEATDMYGDMNAFSVMHLFFALQMPLSKAVDFIFAALGEDIADPQKRTRLNNKWEEVRHGGNYRNLSKLELVTEDNDQVKGTLVVDLKAPKAVLTHYGRGGGTEGVRFQKGRLMNDQALFFKFALQIAQSGDKYGVMYCGTHFLLGELARLPGDSGTVLLLSGLFSVYDPPSSDPNATEPSQATHDAPPNSLFRNIISLVCHQLPGFQIADPPEEVLRRAREVVLGS